MPRFIARNIVKFVLLLLAVSLVAFTLVSVSPIDPVQANVGQAAYVNMSEAKRAQLAEYWGVNTPLWERYVNWITAAFQGDLGTSLRYNAPVADVIATRALNSLALMATAWVVSGVLGFGLGILAGANRGRPIDRIVKGYCFLLASVPTFWLGLVFLVVFSVQLGWFPFGFSVPIGVAAADVTLADALHHLALPALTLQFASISEIFGGSVLVEQVFSYPGLGQAAVTAGLGGDVALLAGIAVLSAAFVFGGNLIANMLYGVVDPRIRRGEGEARTHA